MTEPFCVGSPGKHFFYGGGRQLSAEWGPDLWSGMSEEVLGGSPPLCVRDSVWAGDVIVEFRGGGRMAVSSAGCRSMWQDR